MIIIFYEFRNGQSVAVGNDRPCMDEKCENACKQHDGNIAEGRTQTERFYFIAKVIIPRQSSFFGIDFVAFIIAIQAVKRDGIAFAHMENFDKTLECL